MAAESSAYLQSVPVIAQNHEHDLIVALHKQQQSGNNCDVWLVIENEKFAAHKAVLASFSSYFHTLFENGQKGDTAASKVCNVKEIVLSSVKKSTFLPILHFLYTSQLHVFKENIKDILRTSKKLQITSVIQICTKLIEDDVVLPTLSDAGKTLIRDGAKEKNEEVLFVDLGEEDDEKEKIINIDSEKEPEASEVENTRQQVARTLLGLENLPDIYSNGWPMRTQENSSSYDFPKTSYVGTSSTRYLKPHRSRKSQPVQLRSVYSMASSPEKARLDVSTTNDPVLSSSMPSCSGISNEPKRCRKKKMEHFECTYCNRIFSKKQNRTRHILIKHSSGHRFICSKCGKAYAIEQSLKYHMSTSVCGKTKESVRDNTIKNAKLFLQKNSEMSTFDTPLSNINFTNVTLNSLDTSQSTEKVLNSNTDLLSESLLNQSFTSASVDDVIASTATLFPSIASLGGIFDTSQSENSLLKLPQDNYSYFSHSTPITDPDSDDDMPTISRVESIRQPFIDLPNELGTNTGDNIGESTSKTISSSLGKMSSSCGSLESDTVMLPIETSDHTYDAEHIIPTSPSENGLSSNIKTSKQQLDMLTPILLQHPADLSSVIGMINKASNSSEGSKSLNRQFEPNDTDSANMDNLPSTSHTDLFRDGLPKCLPCNKVFETLEDLDEHNRKCIKCPYCCRAFTLYSNMKRHMDIYHTVHKTHKCRVCGRAYGIRQSLRLHMQSKHGIAFTTRKYKKKEFSRVKK